MVVNGPKVFNSGECRDRSAVVLPLLALFVFEEPECPSKVGLRKWADMRQKLTYSEGDASRPSLQWAQWLARPNLPV